MRRAVAAQRVESCDRAGRVEGSQRRARRARGVRGAELAAWLLPVGCDARRALSEMWGSESSAGPHAASAGHRPDESRKGLARTALEEDRRGSGGKMIAACPFWAWPASSR